MGGTSIPALLRRHFRMTAAAALDTPAVPPAQTAATRPFSAFEWMVALRYLRARRSQGSISVIAGFSFAGIVLGVAALIVVMSVMNGFRHDLLDKIIGLQGHIFLQGVDTPLNDYDPVTDRVSKVQGIRFALPLVEGHALAFSPYGSSFALVRGVREGDLKRLPGVSANIRQGTLEGFDSGEGVAIGARLAESLSLRAGDKITLLAPGGAQTPFGVTPRRKSYTVAAIFQAGMFQYDNTFIFLPFVEAQAYFNKDGQADVIEVYVDDPDHMEGVRERIEPVLQRPMIEVDWRDRDKTFFDALNVERNVMFSILTLIVLVAALNIISGLIMLVQDKAHDIAVLRTMGATKGAVMRIFLITGAMIGIVGTTCGLILGLLVAHNVEGIRQGLNWLMGANLFPAELYYLSQLPSKVEAGDVVAVVSMTLFLSLGATIYPSWRAAKLDPVEALRYE
jgi:lipoprotein-releasing system permease protein